jgi:hypothetical protein
MPSSRLLPVLCLTLTFATGCETVRSSACPPVVEYTKAEREAAAAEIELLCSAPTMTCRMVRDYLTLRDQVRVCRQPPS